MEVRSIDVCIKVDNKQFVMDKGAHMLLEGAMSFIHCAIQTQDTQKMCVDMMELLQKAVVRHDQKDNNHQKGGW